MYFNDQLCQGLHVQGKKGGHLLMIPVQIIHKAVLIAGLLFSLCNGEMFTML